MEDGFYPASSTTEGRAHEDYRSLISSASEGTNLQTGPDASKQLSVSEELIESDLLTHSVLTPVLKM